MVVLVVYVLVVLVDYVYEKGKPGCFCNQDICRPSNCPHSHSSQGCPTGEKHGKRVKKQQIGMEHDISTKKDKKGGVENDKNKKEETKIALIIKAAKAL